MTSKFQDSIDEANRMFNICIPFNAEQANEETLVAYCESTLDKAFNNRSAITEYNVATSLLDEWLRINYNTFKETEGVYRWAKPLCDRRNNQINQSRAFVK